MKLFLHDGQGDVFGLAERPQWGVLKDEVTAWDTPATVAFQRRRRRTTAFQAGICVVLIFLIARLSGSADAISGVLAAINAALLACVIGFLSAYARLSLRERTLRTNEWQSVEVEGHPFKLLGLPVGTVLRVWDSSSGSQIRLSVYRGGAELLDASSDRQELMRAGSPDKAFLLARSTGAPVVLARRIFPRFLRDFAWSSATSGSK